MADRLVSPIPVRTRDRVEAAVRQLADPELRWKVRRLAEVVYGDGYEDGHSAGIHEAFEDRRATS